MAKTKKKHAKTWAYRGYVIEEDFESWADRTPQVMLQTRTGYVIRAKAYSQDHMVYVPGKYRTLAAAKRGVDDVIKQGFW